MGFASRLRRTPECGSLEEGIHPSGTGRIFGRLKAVASIGDRSNGPISVRDRTYRLGGFGGQVRGWGLGTGPIKSAGQKVGDWHLIEGPRQGARPTLLCK
jgi:hypothetical protein